MRLVSAIIPTVKYLYPALLMGCLFSHQSDKEVSPPTSTGESSPAQPLTAEVGVTWINPSLPIGSISLMDFPTSTTGYLVGDSGMFLTTKDAGLTFIRMPAPPSTLNAIRFFDAETGIALGENALMMTTTDGGSHWKQQHLGISTFNGLCIDPSGQALALTEGGTILKSRDRGATWSIFVDSHFDKFNLCAFTDTLHLFVAGQTEEGTSNYFEGLGMRSQDGGSTWSRYPIPDMKKLLAVDTATLLGIGKYGMRSDSGGRLWNFWEPGEYPSGSDVQNLTQSFQDIALTTDSMVYIAAGMGSILSGPLNPPQDTMSLISVDEVQLRAIAFPVRDTGYAAGDSGLIVRTVDAGKTWQPRNIIKTRANLASITFVDSAVGFTVGDHGTALKTTDGGLTWNPMKTVSVQDLKSVHFADRLQGAIVGSHGTVLWTLDGGATWGLGGTGADREWIAIRMVNATTAYLASSDSVFKTLDGGFFWQTVAGGKPGDAAGWDVGDGLFFDGHAFSDVHARLEMGDTCLCLDSRVGVDGKWERHAFTGFNGVFQGYCRADSTTLYAVGGSNLFQIDTRDRTLAYRDLALGRNLRDIACPAPRACIAVGEGGAIVELKRP